MIWQNKINAFPYSYPYDYIGPQPLDRSFTNYDSRPQREDADVVVTTGSGLFDAIDNASSGDIIWLDKTQTADVSDLSRYQDIPSDVTIASDGGRIYQSNPKAFVFSLSNDGARITGLRFEGNHIGYISDYEENNITRGVNVEANVQIDNCDFFGWTGCGISIGVGSDNPPEHWEPHIRHCRFWDNQMSGLGYGCVVYSGEPVIELSYFNQNRHSIAAGGEAECAYIVQDTYHGDSTLIDAFEQHYPGGRQSIVRYCEFEPISDRATGSTANHVYTQKGEPIDTTKVHNCHFHDTQETHPTDANSSGQPIVQVETGSSTFVSMEHYDNHYGETDAPSSVGIRKPEYTDESNGGDDNDSEDNVNHPSENVWTTVTPDNGRVVFESVPIGEYEVTLQHPDYYNQTHTETLDRNGRAPIYEMTEPVDDPNNIGGTQRRYSGVEPRHADRIRSDDPNITTTVQTANGIETAINNASSGDIIWIDSTARINADSLFRVNIPDGVTLASAGAVLYLTENNSGMFKIMSDTARVTGITFRGFHYDDMKDGTPYNLESGTDPWSTASDIGITLMGDSQVDNCSFQGFCFAGINVGENADNETEFNPHCTIRNCEFEYHLLTIGDSGGGLGYGIACYSGSPSIEYCYFNNNRHSVSGGGANMSRWTVENSFFDTEGLQYGAEMHDTDAGAGRWIRYYNNESAYITNNSGNPRPSVILRGTSTHLSQCTDSWFYNPTSPDPDNSNSPIQQYGTDGTNFNNLNIANNHYGTDTDPPDGVGIQPDGKDYIDLVATITVNDSTGTAIPTPRVTVTADFNADGSTTEKSFTGSDGTVAALLPTGTHDLTIDGIETNSDGETVRSHGPTTISVQMVDRDINVNNGNPIVIEETQEGGELQPPNGPEGDTSSHFSVTVTNVEKTQTGNYTFEILLSNDGGGSGSTDVTLEEQ